MPAFPLPKPGAPQRGVTLWFTGLSGAGKSTLCRRVGEALEARGHAVEYLDGDEVRRLLSRGLGFSREDRDANVERIAFVASRLTRMGAVVLVSAISPYAAARAKARALVEPCGAFVEIFVRAKLATCEARDTKGLYAKARRGELRGLTGVDDPYEAPARPELVVDTDETNPEEAAARVLELLAG